MHSENWTSTYYLHLWPESERLKAALQSGHMDQVYTMPGLRTDQPLSDRVALAARQFGKEVQRPVATNDIAGLKTLIAHGHLRGALNVTTAMLTSMEQGVGMAGRPSKNSPLSFEVWSCRFQLLLALKMYNLLTEELSAFDEMDAPDMFFQFYRQHVAENKSGSMVPFSLRLIHAEAPRFTPEPWTAVSRLQRLEGCVKEVLVMCQRINVAETTDLWRKRMQCVKSTKARTLFFLKEYYTSARLYRSLMDTSTQNEKAAVLEALVRIYVYIGDEKGLERCLHELSIQSNDLSFPLHKSLKPVFYGNFPQAEEQFKSLRDKDVSVAINNEAVCKLYNGKLDEAVKLLTHVTGPPAEPSLLNWSTIVDLSSTNSKELKKHHLISLCDKLSDVFDPQVLKVQ